MDSIRIVAVTGRGECSGTDVRSVLEQMNLRFAQCVDVYGVVETIVSSPQAQPILVVGRMTELSRERMRLFDLLSGRPHLRCCCLAPTGPSRQQTQQIRTAVHAGVHVAGDRRELVRMIEEIVQEYCVDRGDTAPEPLGEGHRPAVRAEEGILTPAELQALLGE